MLNTAKCSLFELNEPTHVAHLLNKNIMELFREDIQRRLANMHLNHIKCINSKLWTKINAYHWLYILFCCPIVIPVHSNHSTNMVLITYNASCLSFTLNCIYAKEESSFDSYYSAQNYTIHLKKILFFYLKKLKE